jgi:CHAD domain-containing protein
VVLPLSQDAAPGGGDQALQPGEPLGPGLKRISLEYLDRACAALAHPPHGLEQGIHTARKAAKRVRALLRLVRDCVGEAAYRNENAVLRDAARGISQARDRTVRMLTLDRILDRHAESVPPGAFEGLRARLAEARDALQPDSASTPANVIDALTTLRTCRRRFAAWAPEGPGAGAVPDDFGAIAPGLGRVYRRGRSGMGTAYQEGVSGAFHLWRKAAKYLRYQVEVLVPLWSEVLGPLASAADILAETLGDEHDATLLGAAVAGDEDLLPDPAARRLLAALVAEEQERLRREAQPLGERVYAETPEAFVRRIGSYWAAARRRSG